MSEKQPRDDKGKFQNKKDDVQESTPEGVEKYPHPPVNEETVEEKESETETKPEEPLKPRKRNPTSRDKAAKETGVGSGRTYDKLKKVTKVIDELRAKGDPENEKIAGLLERLLKCYWVSTCPVGGRGVGGKKSNRWTERRPILYYWYNTESNKTLDTFRYFLNRRYNFSICFSVNPALSILTLFFCFPKSIIEHSHPWNF